MAFQAQPASPVGVQPDFGMGCNMCDDSRTWHQDMPLESWEEWKAEAKKRFIGYEPNHCHLLNQDFIVKFQECANKVLAQLTRGTSGKTCNLAATNFHQLVGIPTFELAFSSAYAGLIRKENPKTLEEAYTIVHEHYAIYVKLRMNKDAKATT
ncbi:hypothetical protein DSO57_1007190 [Entomophthora muscae]|uniref:Uncharacterized protein n=1 Tax=Entomophthora muscae TaxID=34485 RepID=A0ACC2SWL9_9FUNG|nr:hypothetical protein DSO57_1007190 [Entomophthora muscae]